MDCLHNIGIYILKPVQDQISGLVSVAEVDGCKSASWPWEKTVMKDVREAQ